MARLYFFQSLLLLFLLVSTATALHPLDPLTAAEITETVTIINTYRPGEWAFNTITLKEPEKSVLLPYFLSDTDPPPGEIPRRSFTVLKEKGTADFYEVVINLDVWVIDSWTAQPAGVQPMHTTDELDEVVEVIRADPQVQQRCSELGFTNMSLVYPDQFTIGYVDDIPEYAGKRLTQVYMHGRHSDYDNMYAHPFDFGIVFDITEMRIVDFVDLPTHEDFDGDNQEGNIVPATEHNFDPSLLPEEFYRKDLKPVRISQDGPSYSFVDNELSWQKFKMRLGFNGREGLVIHNLNYNDSGTVRPLFYRMALAEMFVPYGDPRSPYYRKHVFDEGEYGMGYCANELQPGFDCLGEVAFLDTVLHDDSGEIWDYPQVVCIHEEDHGILWKHYDEWEGKTTITRSQRLSLTQIVTIGNYDYGLTWSFYQDGSIEYTAKLTGILSSNMFAVNSSPAEWGSVVAPQVGAQYHQHFFTLRLDPEIDGNANSVSVVDVVPDPAATGSARNPHGNAWGTSKVTFNTASSSRTNVAPESSRTWLMSNPSKLNPVTNEPVAWKLSPHASPGVMMKPDSPILEKAGYMEYHTWVTPYKEDQLYPGGFYLNNSGLPEWLAEDPNANVDNTDVVLWYNFGVSHVPRVEDFPVMPVEQVSVFIKPYNFFTQNPALDVPPPTGAQRPSRKITRTQRINARKGKTLKNIHVS